MLPRPPKSWTCGPLDRGFREERAMHAKNEDEGMGDFMFVVWCKVVMELGQDISAPLLMYIKYV